MKTIQDSGTCSSQDFVSHKSGLIASILSENDENCIQETNTGKEQCGFKVESSINSCFALGVGMDECCKQLTLDSNTTINVPVPVSSQTLLPDASPTLSTIRSTSTTASTTGLSTDTATATTEAKNQQGKPGFSLGVLPIIAIVFAAVLVLIVVGRVIYVQTKSIPI